MRRARAVPLLCLAACLHRTPIVRAGPPGAGSDTSIELVWGRARWVAGRDGNVALPVRVTNHTTQRTLRIAAWNVEVRSGGAEVCSLRDPGLVRVDPGHTTTVTLGADCDRRALRAVDRLRLRGDLQLLFGQRVRQAPIDQTIALGA